MTKKKKVVLQSVSAEQANEAFAVYARANAHEDRLRAQMELDLARIRERYAPELQKLQDEQQSAFDVLQVYATEHYAELFVGKKSVDMTHGSLGFRTGTPKLKTMRGYTWASVLKLMQDRDAARPYIRVSEDIDKAKLLAEREQPGVLELMQDIGVCVAQDEAFFVEPKKE